jgi:triacylglycerol lipase
MNNDPRPVHYVFLIPGFFGFANLGTLHYFNGVAESLTADLAARGVRAEVLRADTEPTASLPKRVAKLAEMIAACAPPDAPLHLIGHSTGGLDARLLVSPLVSLPTSEDVEAIACRVQSVVTVATPHQGTPLASFFVGLMGQRLLRVIAVLAMYVARYGKLHLAALKLALRLLMTLDNTVGLRQTVLDRAFDAVLADLNDDTRASVDAFFRNVHQDRALLTQLTPEGIELLNAAVVDRPSVRYGCVVTCGRRPGLRGRAAVGLDPYAQLVYGIYQGAWKLSSRSSETELSAPSLTARAALHQALGFTPERTDNDGLVPTWSQLHGELLCAVRADHADILGHLGGDTLDVLSSGSGFDAAAHARVWRRVAAWLAP